MARYSEYHRDRIGWFFGLSGGQLVCVAAAAMPVFLALRSGALAEALLQVFVWALVTVVVVLRIRGRSTLGWLAAGLRFSLARRAEWSTWRSHAASGRTFSVDAPDLPRPLQRIAVHDTAGLDGGPDLAAVQHYATRVWAISCRIDHDGIGMADDDTRARQAAGLTDLIDAAARTDLVSDLLVMVRVGPDDGADRQLWTARHNHADGPPLARKVSHDLDAWATKAAVRSETFLTLMVPEARIGRPARRSGGGLAGRLRVLRAVAEELEPVLRHGIGATRVEWLTSDRLAITCRIGFHPDDRHGLVTSSATHSAELPVPVQLPWRIAGPARAVPEARCFRHDAWCSVSVTVGLPAQGAGIGALTPLVTPAVPGEGRSLLVAFPIVPAGAADRRTANAEWAADLGDELRRRAGVKQRAKARQEAAKARNIDGRLAGGHALTCPYAVATVTVPADTPVEDAARRLDASARHAGFPPLRLDLAHDVAFAASTVPLGLTLHRR